MDLTPQALPFPAGHLNGLSERLMTSHHTNNYGGAVQRLNAIRVRLQRLDFGGAPGFEINGLKREELIATNSVLLHELYFASLGGDGQTMTPAMTLALDASFGSVDRWRAQFVAMGKALGGGSGWVVLTFLPRDGRLVNQWAADHTDALVGGIPIVALDMYEHSYHMDFGAAAGPYVDAFMANVDWAQAHARYQLAVAGASEPWAANQDDLPNAQVIDVRRAGVFEKAEALIAGARWHDPAAVEAWGSELSKETEVVVYCVYGHEISRAVTLRLRAHGINARFLRGGIDGWQAAGRTLVSRSPV